MLQFEIYGSLVPYAAHRNNGRFQYDPKSKEKEQIRWQIKAQHRGEPIDGAPILDFTFYFAIPKATSKIRRRQMLAGLIVPTVAPDCSNLIKLYEDCLKGIVIQDDRFVSEIVARRRFAEAPSVLIRVIPYQEKYGGAGC